MDNTIFFQNHPFREIDVLIVMKETGETKNVAIAALYMFNGDVVDAVVELIDGVSVPLGQPHNMEKPALVNK
jgi:hypothetical protein